MTSCVAAAALASCAQASVTYSDGTFDPSQWGNESILLGSGGSASFAQSLQGNPGPSREIDLVVNEGGATVWAISRYGVDMATRYVPSTQGAITSINFSIDARFISGSVLGEGQQVKLMAKQGTRVFGAGLLFTDSDGLWRTLVADGLTAADFVALDGLGGSVNFSSTGAPIRFGFAAGATFFESGANLKAEYDNFSVTVIPAPGALALLGLGAVAAGRRRR
jgi:hypothetical protein